MKGAERSGSPIRIKRASLKLHRSDKGYTGHGKEACGTKVQPPARRRSFVLSPLIAIVMRFALSCDKMVLDFVIQGTIAALVRSVVSQRLKNGLYLGFMVI
jgi:hypothetical protein